MIFCCDLSLGVVACGNEIKRTLVTYLYPFHRRSIMSLNALTIEIGLGIFDEMKNQQIPKDSGPFRDLAEPLGNDF